MDRKHLLKIFILLSKKSHFNLNDILDDDNREDVYSDFDTILNKMGVEGSEAGMVIGSLILTLENGKVKYINENTNPDLIEIQEPKDRSVGYTEYGRYKNYGKYYISETYSDVEALYKAKNGLFDDSVVYDSDHEETNQDIDDRDIEIE